MQNVLNHVANLKRELQIGIQNNILDAQGRQKIRCQISAAQNRIKKKEEVVTMK